MFELPGVPDDTDAQSREKMLELIKAMSVEQRLAKIFELSSFAKQLILEDIKRQNPQASTNQIKQKLCLRLYGKEGAKFAKYYE
mgnify:CR=1 FL=1